MGLTSYNFNLLPLSQAGSAVSGATVRVADSEQETESGDNGDFRMNGVSQGKHEVDIEKTDASGRKFMAREYVDVTSGQTADMGTVELQGTGAIDGGVSLSDKGAGNYLGITVYIPDAENVALTDDGGAYAISGIEPGTYTVVMSMTGYISQTVAGVNVTSGSITKVPDVMLVPDANYSTTYGIVSGKVVDSANQQGVSGVIVAVQGTSLATLTDQDGGFSLGLTGGKWTIIASGDQYSVGGVTVNVTVGNTVSATIQVSKLSGYNTGIISGTVEDENGAPVASAVIQSDPSNGSAFSDNNGLFSLTLPAGCYTLKVDKSGYTESDVLKCIDAGQSLTTGVIVLMPAGSSSCIGYSCAAPVPSGLIVTAGNGQVSLTWSASTGATSYNIYKSTTSGGPYTKVGSTTNTSYTVTGLTNGTTYYFVVTAVNSNGESGYSNQASATPLSPPPPVIPAGTEFTYTVGSHPDGIAIDNSGNVWVTDWSDLTVTKFNSIGITIGTYVVGSGGGNGGIAIDSAGNVWIANIWNNEIIELNSFGTIIGTYAVGTDPNGIAIDSAGNVWVTNWLSNNVTELNSSGITIGTYAVGTNPFGITIDASGNVWVVNNGSNNVTELNSSGTTIGTYAVGTVPREIAIDVSGNVWVTNSGSNNVTKLSPTGATLGTYSVSSGPRSIAIDASGNVWVTNWGATTVTKLSPTGATLGTYLVGSGPNGIAIDASGNVWVANSSSNNVTKLLGITTGPQYFPYGGPQFPGGGNL
ncbi:MAG: carboxypeptidase regulatory-like domain-containing protein [Deltaproteobacteria bacterium]|nr:carboxypeptidase regulatory-like domain-containing protein [Deltaproteobacteria bacterium]